MDHEYIYSINFRGPVFGVQYSHKNPLNESPPVTSLGVLAAHLFWFLIGPIVLAIITVQILQSGIGWATAQDAAFFVIIGLMVFSRWFDQKSGQGTTIEGVPSSWPQFRRYVLTLASLSVALWVIANILGNYFLNGGAT